MIAEENQAGTKRATIYVILFVALLIGSWALSNLKSWQTDGAFHTLVGAVAMLLASFIGVVALVRFYSKKTNLFLFIGTGFIGTAFLDGYHAVVTSTYFAPLIATENKWLIPWSWLASRLFLSVFMWVCVISEPHPDDRDGSKKLSEEMIYILAGLFTMGCFVFFYFVRLGTAYFDSPFVGHKIRPQEIVAGLFFLMALIGFIRRGDWQRDVFLHWLVISLIVGALSQIAFMMWSGYFMPDGKPFDIMFDAAHFLKVASYSCVLIGLLVSTFRLFQQAEHAKEEIAGINLGLKKEIDERKEAEDRISSVLDATPNGMVMINKAGEIVLVNHSAEEQFGYARNELMGQPVEMLIPARFRAEHPANRDNYFHDHTPRIMGAGRILFALRKDGTEFPVEIGLNPIEIDEELFVLSAVVDVTERQRAEKERAEIFSSIRDAVARLSACSNEILTTTTQQSSGAQEQAAAISETATTMDEIAQTAEQAAERSDTVARDARQAEAVGREGQQAVAASVDAMNGVRQQVESIANNILSLAGQAQAIGEITTTVNNITEQTNLLALNAAIEASRAGEHGKGFAVVAAEIKGLAEQAKKATTQIRTILGDIQTATNSAVLATEHGTNSVNEAGDVVKKAGDTIAKLADTIGQSVRTATQISGSVSQQSAGIRQLNDGMRNVENVTRQNVDAIQHIENAAQRLSEVSNELAALTTTNRASE